MLPALDATTINTALILVAVCVLVRISVQLSELQKLLKQQLPDAPAAAPALTGPTGAAVVTPEQRAAYLKQSQGMVEQMLEFTSPKSTVNWQSQGTVDGAAAYFAQLPGSDVVCTKGVIDVKVTEFDDVVHAFTDANTTELLYNQMSEVDKQFVECRVLGLVDKQFANGKAGHDGAPPSFKAQLEWQCFKAPPVYPRDFCWLSVCKKTVGEGGRAAFVSICQSVERAECPDLWQDRGFVRGEVVRAGYVFRATADPQIWQLSYVVQIDPKGLLPKFIVNLVARDQAGVAGRMASLVHRGNAASAALRSSPAAGGGAASVSVWASQPLFHVPVGGAIRPQRVPLGTLAAGQRVAWQLWAEDAADSARVGCCLVRRGDEASVGSDGSLRKTTPMAPPPAGAAAPKGVLQGEAAVAVGGEEYELLLDYPPSTGWFGGELPVVFYQWRLV